MNRYKSRLVSIFPIIRRSKSTAVEINSEDSPLRNKEVNAFVIQGWSSAIQAFGFIMLSLYGLSQWKAERAGRLEDVWTSQRMEAAKDRLTLAKICDTDSLQLWDEYQAIETFSAAAMNCMDNGECNGRTVFLRYGPSLKTFLNIVEKASLITYLKYDSAPEEGSDLYRLVNAYDNYQKHRIEFSYPNIECKFDYLSGFICKIGKNVDRDVVPIAEIKNDDIYKRSLKVMQDRSCKRLNKTLTEELSDQKDDKKEKD